MASHVRSSLQQVIDTLMWVQTTDEEQLAVAFSRMPVHERRAFLARAQDAVFNSHSHATGSAAVEATYLDTHRYVGRTDWYVSTYIAFGPTAAGAC